MKRQNWISIGKFFAIVAVLIDHTYHYCYDSEAVWYSSYFSVSLFILLSGITSYISMERSISRGSFAWVLRHVGAVFMPYAVATAFYQLAYDEIWDLKTYIEMVLNFNGDSVFYFVVFFIQLQAVAPVLYGILNSINSFKNKLVWHICVLVVLCVFVAFSLKFTFMLPVHGGGKYLFGGTYMLLYYIGMIFASRQTKILSRLVGNQAVLVTVAFIATIAWYILVANSHYVLKENLPMWDFGNPPGVGLGVFGILVGAFVWRLVLLLENVNNRFVSRILGIIARLGDCSLYIFLYHKLMLKVFTYLFPDSSIWFNRLIVFPCILLGPCVMKLCWDMVKRYWKERVDALYMREANVK